MGSAGVAPAASITSGPRSRLPRAEATQDRWGTRTRTETARLQRPAGCRLPHPPRELDQSLVQAPTARTGTVGSAEVESYGAVGYGGVARDRNHSSGRQPSAPPASHDLRERPMSTAVSAPPRGPKPMTDESKGRLEQTLLVRHRRSSRSSPCSAPSPVAWGWGISWLDVGLARRLLRRRRPRHHGRLPPLLHPRLVQGQAPAADRARGRRLAGRRGPRDPLGRRPPPAPRLQRQGGRPALALALRRDRAGAAQGPAGSPTSAGCSTSSTPTSSGTPPTCWQDKALVKIEKVFPLLVLVSFFAAGRCSAAWSRCPGPARCPRSSGPAWSGSRCCTTSPGRSTRSATRSASARSRARDKSAQLLAAGDPVLRRVVAQLCTTPTRPCARHGVLRGQIDISAPG